MDGHNGLNILYSACMLARHGDFSMLRFSMGLSCSEDIVAKVSILFGGAQTAIDCAIQARAKGNPVIERVVQ